ncbi:MAG: hypothetical protein ACRC06_16745 [Waterburya sp.]
MSTFPYYSTALLMVIKMKYQIVLQYIVLNMFLLMQLEVTTSNFAFQTQNAQIPVSTFTASNKF